LGTLAALLGAVGGHWLDLTTWREQRHQDQMARVYESTSDILAGVVYAMDEVSQARRDSVHAASARGVQDRRADVINHQDSVLATARTRIATALWDYNTKAPGLEALLGVYFSDTVRNEFRYINDVRLPAYDSAVTASDTVAVAAQSDAIHPAIEQFDHNMAALLRGGRSLDPFDYRIRLKHPTQQEPKR